MKVTGTHPGPAARLKKVAPLTLVFAAAGAWVTSSATIPQTDTAEEIRSLQREFIRLKDAASKERAQLSESRLFLEEEIALLEQRVASFKDGTATLERERENTADKRAELEQKKALFAEGTKSLEDAILGLEARLLSVRKMLPAPLLEEVNRLTVNLPKDAADAEKKGLSLYSRYVHVVGALNQIDNFNDDIDVQTESVEIPGLGQSASVTVVYLGAGQAYYISSTGEYAGVGRPASTGFVWTPDNSIAPAIQELKAIREGQSGAAFVQIPVKVD